jgi:hydroxymethylbilane synthase
LPAIGQGAIGIECRVDDQELNDMLGKLHDQETGICVTAERAMNARLSGGCQVPVAGFAEIRDNQLFMRGLVGNPDGSQLFRSERSDKPENAAEIGAAIAEDLLKQGADKVLQALYQ